MTILNISSKGHFDEPVANGGFKVCIPNKETSAFKNLSSNLKINSFSKWKSKVKASNSKPEKYVTSEA